MSIDADRIIAIRTDKIVYRNGDTVLKVFDPAYSTADIFNEALNQARIEETGFPVPKIMDIQKLDGKWAIRREYAQGITLERLMLEKPENRESYLDRFTDVQREIFSLQARQLNRQKYKLAQRIGRASLPEEKRSGCWNGSSPCPTATPPSTGTSSPPIWCWAGRGATACWTGPT